MAVGNRIVADICGIDITVSEARELFRRAVVMANALKAATGISAPATFVKAEAARIAFQAAIEQLSGDEVSRIRGTVLAKNIVDRVADLCRVAANLWVLGVDFGSAGDQLVQARDTYADWTQQIKKNHALPPVFVPAAPATLPSPVDESSNLGLGVAVGGAALGLLGLALWAHSRA